MRKYIAAAVLSAGLLVASTATNSNVLAQGDKAKVKVKEAPAGGHIEVGKGKDGKYRFTVRDADEKYLGGSTVGHATEKECLEAIEMFKKVVATAKVSMKGAKPAK